MNAYHPRVTYILLENISDTFDMFNLKNRNCLTVTTGMNSELELCLYLLKVVYSQLTYSNCRLIYVAQIVDPSLFGFV